jgi:hypothetical protein
MFYIISIYNNFYMQKKVRPLPRKFFMKGSDYDHFPRQVNENILPTVETPRCGK